MERPNALAITVPVMPDEAIEDLAARLRRLKGVEGATSTLDRCVRSGDDVVIVLKISQEGLKVTGELLPIVGNTIDIVLAGSETLTLTLPNGTVIGATRSMSADDLVRRLKDAEAERCFDVAVSFADENRPYVGKLVKALGVRRVSVFYDVDHAAELWGRDLAVYLDDLYRNRSKYVVVFVSKHYLAGVWARHELQCALATALRERQECILPARFDDSEVPGLPPTLGWVDCRHVGPDELAEMICTRLGR